MRGMMRLAIMGVPGARGGDSSQAYGVELTLNLKPDATDGIDTYIQSSAPTTNYSTSQGLFVGEWSGAAFVNRALLKFDLSAIPANTRIVSADLVLIVTGKSGASQSGTLSVYRQKRAWVEAEATWNIYATGNNWHSPGGFGLDDCEQAAIGAAAMTPASISSGDRITVSLDASAIQAWVDGATANNGLLVKMAEELDNDFAFGSSDHVNASYRPEFNVVYQHPTSDGTASHTRLADMPLAVDQHSFVELDGLLYLVAGRSPTTHSAEVHAYNPATDTWSRKADLPHGAQSGVLHAYDGKLYYIGGHNSQLGEFYSNVYEYDPVSNAWTEKTAMPTPREDFGSALVDGKIYCFGGLTNTPSDYTPTKVLEVYDIATDTWDQTKADMPDFKHFGDFGAAYDGKVYAIGGSNTFDGYAASGYLAPRTAVWEYDPATDTWTTRKSCLLGTCYKDVVALGTKLYAISGVTSNVSTKFTRAIQEYDPATDTWRYAVPATGAPYEARGAALAVHDGAIYMCGGWKDGYLSYLYRLDVGA